MIVSRETLDKFSIYRTLLQKWQKTINLVSAETLPDVDRRHFDDSVQLVDKIRPEVKTVCDWGSGAGFPGLVIAMMRPDLVVSLIESDQRKCAFIRVVSRETKTPVKIYDTRLEELAWASDLVTARAFAPLNVLLAHGMRWTAKNGALEFLLLKGQTAEDEITLARGTYDFDTEISPSRTETGASILSIRNLTAKP